MRRALAAALLGISLWLGSLAWSGFLLTRTVLDPDRSQDVAQALYDDEAVRDRLAANIAGGVEAGLPPGFPVERSTLDAGAERALESPAVEALVVDAFVRTHQAMLGEGDVPRRLDAGSFGAAGRASLVDARPELDAVLPSAPEVVVPLPTERVPDLGPVRRGLLTAVPVLATAAAIGALLALLVSRNRPAVIRRAGVWAVLLSAGVLAVAYGVPALAATFAPSQSEVVAALVSAMAAETRVPAITLGALGVAGIVVSLFWRAAPALLADPAPVEPRQSAPRRRRRREPRLVGGPPPRRDIPRPTTRADAPTANRSDDARTRVQPAPSQRHDPVPDATRVDGWVVESADQIPPGARWVPGVGYVVEDG